MNWQCEWEKVFVFSPFPFEKVSVDFSGLLLPRLLSLSFPMRSGSAEQTNENVNLIAGRVSEWVSELEEDGMSVLIRAVDIEESVFGVYCQTMRNLFFWIPPQRRCWLMRQVHICGSASGAHEYMAQCRPPPIWFGWDRGLCVKWMNQIELNHDEYLLLMSSARSSCRCVVK